MKRIVFILVQIRIQPRTNELKSEKEPMQARFESNENVTSLFGKIR
jgi:hypothetical protein